MAADGMLCVLLDETHKTWSVWLCEGVQQRKQLKSFALCSEALEFAIAEEERLRKEEGLKLVLSLPDDCPCYDRWTLRKLRIVTPDALTGVEADV